jgi:hypothetical protein
VIGLVDGNRLMDSRTHERASFTEAQFAEPLKTNSYMMHPDFGTDSDRA